MSLTYQAILNVDYTAPESNEYARLKHALVQAGWRWVETSAFVIDTDNLGLVWRGVDIVARQTASVGQLSAFTFHIQGSDHFIGGAPSGDYPHALDNVLGQPFPHP